MNTEQNQINVYLEEKGIMPVLERYFNGMCIDKKNDAHKIHEIHRYLQSEIFSFLSAIILEFADMYEQKRYDARNEYACKSSYFIRSMCYEKIGDNWYITAEL